MTKLGPHVEQALNELDNAAEFGGDTTGPLKRLAAAGLSKFDIVAARRAQLAHDTGTDSGLTDTDTKPAAPTRATAAPAGRAAPTAQQQTTAATAPAAKA